MTAITDDRRQLRNTDSSLKSEDRRQRTAKTDDRQQLSEDRRTAHGI
jgi:hypothetical protein